MADVQMNYDTMRQMSRYFKDCGDDLNQNLNGLNLIAGLVDGGALVGRGGQRFSDLLQNGIIPFTRTLMDKMEELSQDVEGARAALQDGDTSAASRFK